MRAVVLHGADLDVVELPDPSPAPDQVLVAPLYTGICGSDLHMHEVLTSLVAMPELLPGPIVPGHEFAGEVVAVGSAVGSGIKVGDLVAGLPFSHGPNGFENIGVGESRSGALAELLTVDAERTFILPEGLPAQLGALCEPLAVSLHAFGLASEGGPVVVLGAGPVGLGVIALAAAAGRFVVAVDPSPERRAMAEKLGATRVLPPGTPIVEAIDGSGFRPSPVSPLLDGDPERLTIIECAGRPDVVQTAINEAPTHSQIVLAGACPHDVSVGALNATLNEVSIVFSFAYRHSEFGQALRLLADEPDRWSQMITDRRPLEQTKSAFRDLATNPSHLKILIQPNQPSC